MREKIKKTLTFVCSGIFFLLGGIEYAVILPTLNQYLKEFTDKPVYMGVVLSSFSLAGLLVAPVFGVAHDRLRKTKAMLLFANLFEIVGNFMYFIASGANMIILSRFIAGLGAGVGASMLAQIARTTTDAERSAAFALFMAARQFGLLFGPGLNLFLEQMDFYIGPWHCNSETAPGFFMAVVWSLFQVQIIFTYYDFPFLVDTKGQEQERVLVNPTQNYDSIQPSLDSNGTVYRERSDTAGSGKVSTLDQTRSIIQRQAPYSINESRNYQENYVVPEIDDSESSDLSVDIHHPKMTFMEMLQECLREEIVVMLGATFIFFFCQTSLETCMTPLTDHFLDMGEMGNSLLYCLAGGEIIIGFIAIKFLSKKFQDRSILALGLAIEICSLIFLCIFLPNATPHDRSANFVWLIPVFIFQVSGLPFILVPNVSLLSKLVPQEIQGFSQGIRRSIMGIGTIMGPLWATGAITVPIAYSTTMVFLFVLTLGMLLLSWNKMSERNTVDPEHDQQPVISSGTADLYNTNEKSHLLGGTEPVL